MKSKLVSSLGLSVFILVVLLSFASALNAPASVSLNKFKPTSFTITYDTATETISSLPTSLEIPDGNDHSATIQFHPSEETSGTTKTVTVSANITLLDDDFLLGVLKSVNYNISYINGTIAKTIAINFENTPINEYEDNGKLDISDVDLSVENNGFGPEDTEWYPLDEIKAKIYVNAGNHDLKNIYVHWGFYNTDTGKWIVNGKETRFSLDADEEKIVSVTFQIDKLSKLKDTQGDNFIFYSWAEGVDKDDNDKDISSSPHLDDITLDISDHFVILSNILIDEKTSCGGSLHITADVTNIGNDDEEGIYVTIYNKELGIDKKVTVDNIDSLEDGKLDATISIPEDATEKTYALAFYVYNEDDEVYTNDNDDESKFQETFTVEGCSTTPAIDVVPVLESKAEAGKELTVKATILNTGSKKGTFTVSLNGYDSWAALSNIDKTSLELESGTSADVIIKLKVNDGVSGENKFNIAVAEGSKIFSKPVSVEIEKSLFSGLPSITGLVAGLSGNNWYLWAIGGLNVLLVLIIIVVAVRISKKKE